MIHFQQDQETYQHSKSLTNWTVESSGIKKHPHQHPKEVLLEWDQQAAGAENQHQTVMQALETEIATMASVTTMEVAILMVDIKMGSHRHHRGRNASQLGQGGMIEDQILDTVFLPDRLLQIMHLMMEEDLIVQMDIVLDPEI